MMTAAEARDHLDRLKQPASFMEQLLRDALEALLRRECLLDDAAQRAAELEAQTNNQRCWATKLDARGYRHRCGHSLGHDGRHQAVGFEMWWVSEDDDEEEG